jgi:hypothetical protein
MGRFFTDYLESLGELHEEILNTIKNLSPAALDWFPFPGGNSFNVIVTHLIGAEKYWLGDVVAGEPSGRDRPAEFKVKNLDHNELKSRLAGNLAYAEEVLINLDLHELETTRISPRDGREVSVTWALEHALKHTAIHLGHLQITRQLWEEQLGD